MARQGKQQPRARIYICGVCGREVSGNHVYIKTRRGTELHIHFGCMSGRGEIDHADKTD